MKIRKVVTGLGIASLLIALPAGAQSSKESSGSSGSSGASSGSMGSGSSSGSSGSASEKSGSQSGSSTMGKESTGTAGGTAAGGTAAAGEQQLSGKVEKVDHAKKQLTLQLKVDESTQVMKDGKSATLQDIKEGDQVRASFSGDQVQRIEVMSTGAPGEKRTPSGAAPSGAPSERPSGSAAPGGGSSSSPGSSQQQPGGSSGRGY